MQAANGTFNNSVMKYVKNVEKEAYSEEIVLTIIGVKLLQKLFGEDKMKWKFVVLKARKHL